jgi:DNA polymerase zeta
VTQAGPYGFKDTPPVQGGAFSLRERETMTVFALEVFGTSCEALARPRERILSCPCYSTTAPSRGNLVPDPRTDPLEAAFYSFQDSNVELRSSDFQKGVVVVENALMDPRTLRDIPVQVVATELDLLNTIVDLVLDLDPDIVTGWEVQSSSWGYLSARGLQYGL